MPVNSRRSLFWRIYIIALAAAFVLLAAGMIVLRVRLSDYEKSQPDRLAREIFNKNFAGASAEGITNLISRDGCTDEQKAQLLEEVREALAQGELTYREVTSGSQSDYEKYVVQAGDRNIASFTLRKIPGSDRQMLFSILTLKYARYEFGSIMDELSFSTDDTGKYPVVITAPAGYTVMVDGVQLTDDFITESEVELDAVRYTPQGLAPKFGVKYRYPSMSAQPGVICASPAGMPAEVTYDAEKNEYLCSFVYDEYLQQLHEPLILEAAEIYSRYLTNDTSFKTLSYYLDPESLLYEQTRTTQTGFVIDHNGYEFRDESTSEYMIWSDSVFSCRVKLTEVLHKNGSEDFFEILDKIYFFRVQGEDLLIFDSFNMN